MSTSIYGSPDLDLRPAPLMRHTMDAWLERCPHCGLVAPDIEKVDKSWSAIVQSPSYQAELRAERPSDLVRKFVCWSLIAEKTASLSGVVTACQQVAWVYDDLGDSAAAAEWRKRAADALQVVQEQEGQEGSWLVLVDLWRRAGCFDKAQGAITEALVSCKHAEVRAVLELQRKLTQAQDTSAHTLDEA